MDLFSEIGCCRAVSPGCRVVKLVGVANQLDGHQVEVLPAKRMTVPRQEVAKRHSELATDPGVHLMHLAGVAHQRPDA